MKVTVEPVRPDQPLDGTVVEVLMAYSIIVCPDLGEGIVTVFTVMLLAVGEPFTVGGPETAAPSPLATALAVTVPVVEIGEVAPVTLTAGMTPGTLIVVPELAVVGVPLIGTVTTVELVLTAVPAVTPAGKPAIVKWVGLSVPVPA